MQLEDYFDMSSADDIRVKGTRIGIEHILYQYIHRAQSPEAIAEHFHTLTLEQVYATILYYHANQKAVSAYIADWLAWGQQMREQQKNNPPPFLEKLRQFQAQKDTETESQTVLASL